MAQEEQLGMAQEEQLKKIPFVRELMKGKSEEEIQEAEENFREYLRIVKRIGDRIVREKLEKEERE